MLLNGLHKQNIYFRNRDHIWYHIWFSNDFQELIGRLVKFYCFVIILWKPGNLHWHYLLYGWYTWSSSGGNEGSHSCNKFWITTMNPNMAHEWWMCWHGNEVTVLTLHIQCGTVNFLPNVGCNLWFDSDLYSASINTVLHEILCFFGPHYNGTQLYMLFNFLRWKCLQKFLMWSIQKDKWIDWRIDLCIIRETDLCFSTFNFNSLWPGDAIWWQRSGSTLAQVMACCLTAPSHYLNQCWLIISEVQWYSQEMPQPAITKIYSKITYLKFHSNLPGANEFNVSKSIKKWVTYVM